MYSSTLSLTSTLGVDGWLVPRPGCFTAGKETGYPLYSRLVSPRAGLGGCGKYRLPTEIPSPDRPVRSESLYRQSYPGLRLYITDILMYYLFTYP